MNCTHCMAFYPHLTIWDIIYQFAEKKVYPVETFVPIIFKIPLIGTVVFNAKRTIIKYQFLDYNNNLPCVITGKCYAKAHQKTDINDNKKIT